MKVGARDSDEYLAGWRRGAPEPCGDDLAAEADKAIAQLLQLYDLERLQKLVQAGGYDHSEKT